MIKLNPYVNFPGNTEEAFNFYKSVFGGEFATVMRFKDIQGMEQPAGQEEKIMHIALPIGEEMLMATDVTTDKAEDFVVGDNFTLSLSPDSKEEADRLFAALSEGGKVEVPMKIESWGDYFGMFKDKFGMRWMINFQTQEDQAS